MSVAMHGVDPQRRLLRARLDRHGLVVEDEARGEYLRFDADGRLVAWRRAAALVRRGRLHEAVADVRRPGRPAPADAAGSRALFAAAARRAESVRREVEVGDARIAPGGPPRDDLLRALSRAAAWDAPRHDAERAAAAEAHPEGIPILPPHRRTDVVVEPARGCPNGTCSFCAFYRGRRFRPLDDADFDAHLARVVRAFGRSLAARDGVFLGSASAASLPDPVLLRRLGRIDEVLARKPRGAAAFLDPDRSPRREIADWARLARAGLVDVTVGLETGDPALRRASGKSGDVAAFADVVRRAKEGGLRVAVCVLLGLGGPEAAARHREESRDALARMALGAGDLVYLSPLASALPRERAVAEERAWRAGLATVTPARVVPYGADRFLALA